MAKTTTCICLLILFCDFALGAQLQPNAFPVNAGPTIAGHLMKCYNVSGLRDRESRMPSTTKILIDLIRRIEDAAPQLDTRNLATQIVHRFRQDGIRKIAVNNPSIRLPYTLTGYQRYRNLITLWKLIPGEGLASDVLSDEEQCALHFMLSSSLELERRPNENSDCSKMSQYRRRLKRSEDFSEITTEKPKQKYFEVKEENLSTCPVESGVVYDIWGSVQAGTVLSALAAGLSEETIAIPDESTGQTLILDSVTGVTIAADLTEISVLQAPMYNHFTIGDNGNWNSTLCPRWYFVESKRPNVLSNADLRADMDGLILGKNIKRWINEHNTLTLSQILDMYYSNRPVFGEANLRACDRDQKWRQYATQETLLAETKAFAYLYNRSSILPATLSNSEMESLMKTAIENFATQNSKLNDLKCDPAPVQRAASDLIIVLDTSWNYRQIYPVLSYFLEKIDVNKYESSYTVINAYDGSVMVNRSSSLLDFHQSCNATAYNKASGGFKPNVFSSKVENLLYAKYADMKKRNFQDAKSSIVLMVAKSVNGNDAGYLESRFGEVYDRYYPDTTFLALGAGNPDPYKRLVRNLQKHVFTLNEASTDESAARKTINDLSDTILMVPRKLINPSCGSDMEGSSQATSTDLFVEPTTRNHYKLSVNYLRGDGTKTVRLTKADNVNVTVCHSRTEPNPKNCQPMTNRELTLPTIEACYENCEPLYIAIEAGASNQYKCVDKRCRFLDNVKVAVQMDGLRCSSASAIISSAFLTLSIFATLKLIFN